MSASLKLPPEIADAVVKATAKILADEIVEQFGDLQLFTIRQTAERLAVSEKQARRIVGDYVDMGEASRRVSANQLRELIAKRTVRKGASR